MSGARLRALRMVGFKSFAERTHVEFGAGISAIVGPNGSGKSNLADALRWALGEQGRSLRTRRAEDLIFAGSSSRRAVGMADVSLVIDNSDRLLPVDYGEIELARRLYRSGENEYLLNRQRIRLRDLVELLDEANLADNAFLFIGQGMVDQALALRPEERRPLFEEAAGIRRHERRRRQAEGELTEAESNLERVRDLITELRPQARRLAAQAEQQEQRRTAGSDLAAALVTSARARLGSAERSSGQHRRALAAARRDADASLARLRGAEERATELTHALAERAEAERAARVRLDAARARVVELRLAEARVVSEAQAADRDRSRIAADRDVVARRAEDARRALAMPLPPADQAAEDALEAAERQLSEATSELAALRDAGLATDEQETHARQARVSRSAEHDRLRRQATEAGRAAAEAEAAASEAETRRATAGRLHDERAKTSMGAAETEMRAESDLEAARRALAAAESEALAAAQRATACSADLASRRARVEHLDALLAAGLDDHTLRSARARGGRRLTDGLEVDPTLRAAVEGALGDALNGLAVNTAAAIALRDGRATLLLTDAPGKPPRERDAARAEEAALSAGGGSLGTALRRDPDGQVGRLLARCLWVPDLEAALLVRPLLPAGWRVVTRAGELLTDDGVLRLGDRPSVLELRAEREGAIRSVADAKEAESRAGIAASTAATARDEAMRSADRARHSQDAARRDRRVAEEAERAASRQAETAAREAGWASAQRERLAAEAVAAHSDLAVVQAEVAAQSAGAQRPDGRTDAARQEIASLEARVGALRAARDGRSAVADVARRERVIAEEARRRAEITLTIEGARLDELDRETSRLVGAGADVVAARDRIATDLAGADAEASRIASDVEALLERGGEGRADLVAAETEAAAAREELRGAESRSRGAEVAEMEVRLHLEAAREALLVELAGIGDDGLVALLEAGGTAIADRASGSLDDLSPHLESALEAALAAWRSDAEDAPATETPGPSRLTTLRRRYHELGASNPFAAEEFAEVSTRLESLEAQRSDLDNAIRSTRELIGGLNQLITEQFMRTFEALEGAFSRRFRQLFDGGEAQLSLTAPEDLSATGVEITARPPGKKRQPLAMLSGGERALTAVALLMAMLEVRPVPFCVLDEVDAALDEANVSRFSAALRSLAETIQFIVITHNRGTIEAADALYGVTVGDDAVSRVVSLKLAEAERIVDVDGDRHAAARTGHEPVAVPVLDGNREEPARGSAR